MRPSKRGLARSDYAQAVVSSTMAIKIGTTWIVMSSPLIERLLSRKLARDRLGPNAGAKSLFRIADPHAIALVHLDQSRHIPVALGTQTD